MVSSSMRRFVAVVAGVGVAVLGSLIPASAAPAPCSQSWVKGKDGALRSSGQDLDGDGVTDLAVGVPAVMAGGATGAGAVDVRYGVVTDHGRVDVGETSKPQRLLESDLGGTIGAANAFGTSLATARLDGDFCADLAVGAPGAANGTGKVYVALGSGKGVRKGSIVTIEGRSAGEGFGSTVVARDAHLWIGAPNRTVQGKAGAGAVDHYVVEGKTARYIDTIQQGSAQRGAHVGSVLAIDDGGVIAVGAPDADVSGKRDAGRVALVRTTGADRTVASTFWFSQRTAGVTHTPEAGDRFGAALSVVTFPVDGEVDRAVIAVGVPGEGIAGKKDAGLVHLTSVSDKVVQDLDITQDTKGVSGGVEPGDRFGASVLLDGSFWISDDTWPYHLAIGSPGEALGSVKNAGTVTVLSVKVKQRKIAAPTQLYPALYQGAAHKGNVGGKAQAGDQFGASLSTAVSPDWEDGSWNAFGGAAFVVGTPEENAGGKADAGQLTVVGYKYNTDKIAASHYTYSAGAAKNLRYGFGWSTAPTAGLATD